MNITNRRRQEFGVVSGNRRRAADRVGGTFPSARMASGLNAIHLTTKAVEPREADFHTRRTPLLRADKEILFVDPNVHSSGEALNVLRMLGEVQVCREFGAARQRLLKQPPDLLVTNVRLQEYNGLHLVHLAPPQTRCIVYSAHDDLILAREVQTAGGFYERAMRLSRALAGYVQGDLPAQDRRDVASVDRRRFPRGGRRSPDW